MSKFTLELGKLTPVADVMVEKYSFLTAGVYGLIWRHESMTDSVCKTAQTTMAKQLGINAETLRVHIQKLIDDGYIEDLTPGLRNRPHLYKTTGRLKLSLQIVSDAENPLPRRGKSASQTRKIRDESESLIDSLIEKDSSPNGDTPKALTNQQRMVGVLAEVTGMDYKIRTNASRLAKRGKELLTAGYTPEQVEQFYLSGGWWYQNDWRGQRGQRPKPEDIGETIGQAIAPGVPGALRINQFSGEPTR